MEQMRIRLSRPPATDRHARAAREPGVASGEGPRGRREPRDAGGAGRIAILAGSLLLGACANHIAFRDSPQPRTHKDVEKTTWKILANPIEANTSLVQVKIERIEDGFDVTDNVVQRMEEYTPYSPLWELVEIPTGIVALPLGVLMYIGDFVTFGMIPNDAKETTVAYAFAGMNPVLNVEGGAITQRREYRDRGKQTIGAPDREAKTWRRTERGFTVQARFDDSRPLDFSARLDEDTVNVDLFQLAGTVEGLRPRRLVVGYQPPEGALAVEHEAYLPRDLAGRLVDGAACQRDARAQWQDPEGVARCIRRMTELGFDRSAAMIEDEWIKTNEADPVRMAAFEAALRGESLEAPAEEAPAAAVELGAAESPATEPPATEPPAAEPPATEPPAAQEPATPPGGSP